MANTVNASMLAKMILVGAKSVEAKKEFINELNVFPVPDGDTGTNMCLTIISAADEVRKLENPNMADLCKAISSGSLRGARGNSGVILSQLLRGFTKAVKGLEEIDIEAFVQAFDKAQKTAYKAVMKPKEGTILTVAREMAEKAAEIALKASDLEEFFSGVLEEGRASLSRTPDLLPVLKEAGVVDSGGQGLIEMMQGAFDAFLGKEVEYELVEEKREPEVKYLYSCEIVIIPGDLYDESREGELKDFFRNIGDSVVIKPTDEAIKIHLNTNDPGLAIEEAIKYGTLVKAHVETVSESALIKTIKDKKKPSKKRPVELKETGFIAVSIGEGLNGIFSELGVDYVVTGGQTMNPSTDDFMQAIDEVNAKHIFILPNNKNIVLAANQARDLTKDKDIIVIPTKTIPQGISALINFIPDLSPEENEEAMLEALSLVKTGQVTYSVRDTSIDGIDIHEGDFMGIDDSKIRNVGDDPEAVAKELVSLITDEESALISVYFGADTDETTAEALVSELSEIYSDCDVECHNGGQPVYRYLISVE